MEYAEYLATPDVEAEVLGEGFLGAGPSQTGMEEGLGEGFLGVGPSQTQLQEEETPSDAPESEDVVNMAQRKKNFSEEEDQKVVSAWLHVSLDPSVGSQQKGGTFKIRVHERYLETASPEQYRTAKLIENRWGHIQNNVSKFCGCYEQVTRHRASGTTEVDKMSAAFALFKTLHKRPFCSLHCWNILHKHPKWTNLLSASKVKSKAQVRDRPCASIPTTVNVDMDQPVHLDSSVSLDNSTPEPDNDSLQRPLGKKATKKRSREGTEGSFKVWVDELRNDRRKSNELSSKQQEQTLSVEMEMVAIRKDKVRVQENELQFKRDKLVFEQKSRREELQLEHQLRCEQLQLEKQKSKREDEKARELLRLEKQKCEREDKLAFWENTREEERIMAIDCNKLPPAARAYYMAFQDDILQKRMRK